MSDETTLLLCPFCGGEAEFRIFDTICNVECSECFNGTRYYALDDYEQAVAAWNARAEQTCECDGTISWEWTGPTTYYEHELSCGHVITSVDNEPPNYCEECGAKVVQQ